MCYISDNICKYLLFSGNQYNELQCKSAAGAVVSAHSSSVIDFTVADRTTADGYLINNLSFIVGNPTYTITVAANQAYGEYKLAQGAADFAGTISIGNGTIDYGSITVNGSSVSNGNIVYSLTNSNGDLKLNVYEKIPISNMQGSTDGISWRGGGNDTFIFGDNWGKDTVEQLSGSKVTLHFENGSLANWNSATKVYSDGVNSVTVTGTTDITLKFGDDAALPAGVFTDAANENIFEDKNKGMIA